MTANPAGAEPPGHRADGSHDASLRAPSAAPPWAWLALGAAAASTAGAVAAPWPPTAAATTVLLVAGLAALAALVAAGRSGRGVPSGAVLAAGALVLTVAVAIPPRRSQDLWAYASYGSLAAHHHVSPYVHRPADYPSDPLVGRMRPGWRHTRSVYGPAFTALSAGIVWATGGRPLPTRLAFQGMAALAVAATLGLLWRRARAPGALLLVALHPVVAAHVVNGGHNDALIAPLVLAAALAAARRPWLAGLLVGAAASIKLIAVLPAVGLVWWLWRRHDRRAALGAAALAFGVPAAAYLPAGGTAAVAPLIASSGRISRASVWGPLHGLAAGAGPLHPVIGALAVVAVLTAGVWLVAAAVRRNDPATAMAAPLLAYVLLGAYVLPWYLVWVLPLLALPGAWPPQRLVFLVVAALILLAYQYAPGASGFANRLAQAPLALTPLSAVAGAAWLLVAGGRRHSPPGTAAPTAVTRSGRRAARVRRPAGARPGS